MQTGLRGSASMASESSGLQREDMVSGFQTRRDWSNLPAAMGQALQALNFVQMNFLSHYLTSSLARTSQLDPGSTIWCNLDTLQAMIGPGPLPSFCFEAWRLSLSCACEECPIATMSLSLPTSSKSVFQSFQSFLSSLSTCYRDLRENDIRLQPDQSHSFPLCYASSRRYRIRTS